MGAMENFSRVVSKGYSRCRRFWAEAVTRLGQTLRQAVSLAIGAAQAAGRALKRIRDNLHRPSPTAYPYYRHPLPVRIMHWINVAALVILLMSGLNIFNAHPALYWGKSSYRGVPPFLTIEGREDAGGSITGITRIWGYEFHTSGFLGTSGDSVRGFPAWITLPENQWLSLARRWHLFFAWLLVINGITFTAYAAGSGHLRRDLFPTGRDWRLVDRAVIDHLLLRHPQGEEAKNYNVLQKCAYLAVIFFLLPLMILMGLGMSPALDALFPGWVDLFFGRQSIRTIHFVVAWLLVLFAMIHVFEVIVTGLWNNLRSMITGYYRVQSEAAHEP